MNTEKELKQGLFVDRPVGLVSDSGFGVGVGATPVGTALRRDMAFGVPVDIGIVVVWSTAGLPLDTASGDSELWRPAVAVEVGAT